MKLYLLPSLALLMYTVVSPASSYCAPYHNSRGTYKPGFSCPRFSDERDQIYCCATSTYKYCCRVRPLTTVATTALSTTASSSYCSPYYNSLGTYKQGFSCPRYFDSNNAIYCCGTSTYKHCCPSASHFTVVSRSSPTAAFSTYCSSYYDRYGSYRPAFFCPRSFDSSYEIYCCGTSIFKYCCRISHFPVVHTSSHAPASSSYCPSYYNSFGTHYPGFYCPRVQDSSDKIYCCGTSNYKFCCSSSAHVAAIVIGVLGTIMFIIVVCLIICCVWSTCPLYKRRMAGQINTTGDTVTTTTTTNQAPYLGTGMVMQQPAANYPVTQPAIQPNAGHNPVGPIVYPAGPTTCPGGPNLNPAGQTTPAAQSNAPPGNCYPGRVSLMQEGSGSLDLFFTTAGSMGES